MPSDLENQLRLSREQLQQRVGMGDRLDVARKVDHSADFRRKSAAEAAAADLRLLGYSATVARRGLKALLEANKTTPIDSAATDQFVREVVDVVERHGGGYDGWGGPVKE
jgi:regulator of RNase E activity RraB